MSMDVTDAPPAIPNPEPPATPAPAPADEQKDAGQATPAPEPVAIKELTGQSTFEINTQGAGERKPVELITLGGGSSPDVQGVRTFSVNELLRGGQLNLRALDQELDVRTYGQDPYQAARQVQADLDTIGKIQDSATTQLAELNKQLSEIGPGLDPSERDKYIDNFKSTHAALKQLDDLLPGLEANLAVMADNPSSLTPSSAKALLEGYKTLTTNGHTDAAFAFLTKFKDSAGDPNGLKAAILNNVDADTVKNLGTAIFTGSASAVIKQLLPQAQAASGDPEAIGRLADRASDLLSGAIDVDLVAQGEQVRNAAANLKDLLKGAATNYWGKWQTLKEGFQGLSDGEKAVAGLGVALYAASAGVELAQGKIPDAIRDICYAGQGSIQFLTPLTESLTFSAQKGLVRALPLLGLAANGLSALLHGQAAVKNGDIALGIAAGADVVAAIGSLAIFTGWGAPLVAVASAVSGLFDGISKIANASARANEEYERLKGIVGEPDAKMLTYGVESPLNYVAGATAMSGKTLRQALNAFPVLRSGADLAGYGELTSAFGIKEQDSLNLLRATLQGLNDPYGDTMGPVMSELRAAVRYAADPDGEYRGGPLTKDQWKDLLARVSSRSLELPGAPYLSDDLKKALDQLRGALP